MPIHLGDHGSTNLGGAVVDLVGSAPMSVHTGPDEEDKVDEPDEDMILVLMRGRKMGRLGRDIRNKIGSHASDKLHSSKMVDILCDVCG